MNVAEKVQVMLGDVLSLGARVKTLTPESPLLGALPEMDSMAVVNVIAAIEDQFDITINDDEISGENFATLGSLIDFVKSKTGAAS